MIRVLVVDDQPLMRRGIRALLEGERDIDVVGEAENGQDALRQVLMLAPDLVVMDILMPNGDGIEATRAIKQRTPKTQVLVVTVYPDQDLFQKAVGAGAAGYVLKDISPANLVEAIRGAVRSGETMGNSDLGRKMVDYVFQRSGGPEDTATKRASGLTKRETEVLVCVARGLSNKEIAKTLFRSESTVKTHLRIIYNKLKLRNRAQATVFAIEMGLLGKSAYSGDPLSSDGVRAGSRSD